MARHRSTQNPGPSADVQLQQWDAANWHGEEHDEAAGHRARRLLSRSSSGFYGFADRLGSWRRWLAGERWFWRLSIVLASLLVIFTGCFGGLWWRLGAGPINLDMVTPWLAAAIEENIGHGNTVEVGGTQIERAGRIRIAVRIRDIIVRDRDHAIVASAPKAEVRLSGSALLLGRLRAESLNLVDAELAVRITPDGNVTVSAGDNARPLATGVASKKDAGLPPTFPRPAAPGGVAAPQPNQPAATALATDSPQAGLLAGLDWLDSLSLTGLDGQNLNEIGLKNGSLIVDDQQRGNKWNFQNISLSMRRPSSGGVALSLAEEGAQGWSLRVAVGPPSNGVRSVDIKADRVSTTNILLALRLKNLNYSANLPLSGELKGELGRDGLPTYFRGKITAGAGEVVDSDTPEFPMEINSAEVNLDWDANKRVLVAPFKIISGQNRITLLATLEPPNGKVTDWQLGFSGGTVLLAGNEDGEPPVIFNRVSIGVRVDTDKKRVLLTQADFSNGEIGVAGTGSVDYSGEPRITLGFAGTPMSASALKRVWPSLVVADVRQWVVDRVERGAIQRIEVGVNSPVRNLSRKGPPIPDDGLNVTIVANGVTLRPVDGLPSIRDADLKAHITGRTANVSIGQGAADTPAGRKLNISDAVFEVPDTFPKPVQSKVKFRIEGPVPAVAEILASDKLSDLSATLVDPNASKGTASAVVNLALPIKHDVARSDVNYSVTADLGGFAADRLMMNQKVESNSLKVVANNQGYQVKGDVKINGQPASLDYRKQNDGDADIKLQATLDEASRARFGFDLGPAVSGNIPVKLSGKIGGDTTRLGIDADLTQLKLDNVLPGWVKASGKSTRATFNVVQKPQSTRLEDIVIEGGGASIKGSLEVDQNGDLINANFPTYAPSEGDKTSLRAERGPDGAIKVTMRGDVFDGRSFLKTAISGKDTDTKSKTRGMDLDIDVKLGAVAGFFGEALRSVDAKMSRRGGAIKSFAFSGKLGRETPVTADLRGRGQSQSRDVILLETNDAGAFLRFSDTYSKVVGGQLQLAIDAPTSDPGPKEGLLNVRDFTVKGEASLDKLVSGGQPTPGGIGFSRLRAEFSRQNGQLTIREGVLKGPSIGGTIEGNIDYPGNHVRMSGTFVPVYGLNNLLGQVPGLGLFFGGSDEGVFGLTYEVVGTPDKPTLNVNPISAILPGITRKIMDFNTGKQNGGVEFPQN